MPNILRNMRIKRVAFVDEGANPDAHIRFAKNKQAEDEGDNSKGDGGLIKRIIASVAKALEPFSKDAVTFAQEMERRNYEPVSDEMRCAMWAYMDSINSILYDTGTQAGAKAALMRQSTKEYFDLVEASIDNWSKGELKDVNFAEQGEAVLVKMRDALNEQIEKGCGGKKPTKKADDNEGGEDDNDDDEDQQGKGNVKKGVSENMNINRIDEAKMTPEDKAAFEEIKKKYGAVGSEADGGEDGETHEGETHEGGRETQGEDVYKGIHPTVRAEIEQLRKFREDAETREMVSVAKKYELLGRKPEELARVLKSLKDAGGTAFADMISLLDSNLEMVEKSGAYSEIGKRGSAGTSGDAWDKIEAAATEIMKSKPDMTRNEAINVACDKHPELVAEYEKSR